MSEDEITTGLELGAYYTPLGFIPEAFRRMRRDTCDAALYEIIAESERADADGRDQLDCVPPHTACLKGER